MVFPPKPIVGNQNDCEQPALLGLVPQAVALFTQWYAPLG